MGEGPFTCAAGDARGPFRAQPSTLGTLLLETPARRRSSRSRPSQMEHICACSETSRRVNISGEDGPFPKQLTALRKS